jgi:hypothetical protein
MAARIVSRLTFTGETIKPSFVSTDFTTGTSPFPNFTTRTVPSGIRRASNVERGGNSSAHAIHPSSSVVTFMLELSHTHGCFQAKVCSTSPAPENVKQQFPQFKPVESHAELLKEIKGVMAG